MYRWLFRQSDQECSKQEGGRGSRVHRREEEIVLASSHSRDDGSKRERSVVYAISTYE